MATRVWSFLGDEGRALGAWIGGGTAASPQSCKIDAPACPMAFRPKLDSAIHCTAGIIGEAGSDLSRTRAKRASVAGDRLWLAPAKPVVQILDETEPATLAA